MVNYHYATHRTSKSYAVAFVNNLLRWGQENEEKARNRPVNPEERQELVLRRRRSVELKSRAAARIMHPAPNAAAVTVDTAVDTAAADAVVRVEGRVLSAEDIAVEAGMDAILASAPSPSFSNESNESSPNNLSSAGVVSAVRTSRPKKSNKVVPATEVQAALPRVAVEAAVLEAAVVPEVPVEQPKVAELEEIRVV